MSKEALTAQQLIEQLGRYPKTAQVLVIFEQTMPIVYGVTGTLAEADYNLFHLFKQDAAPPDEARVFLTVEFQPDEG